MEVLGVFFFIVTYAALIVAVIWLWVDREMMREYLDDLETWYEQKSEGKAKTPPMPPPCPPIRPPFLRRMKQCRRCRRCRS